MISGKSQTGDRGDAPFVETHGLSKRYGSRIAVDDLDLTVRRGEVYGFIGPNGAGKTTTLRMLLGLIKPTSGTATVMGEKPGAPAGLARIGALVESPTFYPYLSGRDNLRVMAHYSGVARPRVDEVLELVDLSGRADDKFKKYSHGMKQRLGVAATLLKDPELLILDEPTNALDIEGQAFMRTIVRRVAEEGKTVLLSSHDLVGLVEQTCDRVGMIRKEDHRLVFEGTMAELRYRERLLVRAEPLEKASDVAARLPGVEETEVVDEMLRITVDPARAAEINAQLVNAGLRVSELRPDKRSLEEVFLELTGGETI